jgi:hypothetical protein
MRLQHIARLRRPAGVCAGIAALVLILHGNGSSAGIEGSGRALLAVSSGRITGQIIGQGGLVLNGVEYDLAHARITMDGQPAKANQLEVGQIVTVQSVLTGVASGVANQVSYNGNVVGPISQLDRVGGTFTVLGQTVRVDGATVFGDGIPGSGLPGLAVGTQVEVSAFVTASGDLQASRVDLQAPGAGLQVRGAVEALDIATKTFQINNLQIDYSQAVVAGNLLNATTATVAADEYPTAGTLHVTRVRLSHGLGGTNGELGQMQGLVTSVSSGTSFEIGDQPVVTSASTHFQLHGRALGPNLAVHVQGVFNAAGVLVAQSVVTTP